MIEARKTALKLCNAIKKKNWQDFIDCFNTDDKDWQFVDILPGGKVIKGSQDLIDLHPNFFNSVDTVFEPLSGKTIFEESDFIYHMDWGNVCQFAVEVKVIKPKELTSTIAIDSSELIAIKNILSITMVYDQLKNKWYPGSITNTIID